MLVLRFFHKNSVIIAIEQACIMKVVPSHTHHVAEWTRTMQVKCFAQGQQILIQQISEAVNLKTMVFQLLY